MLNSFQAKCNNDCNEMLYIKDIDNDKVCFGSRYSRWLLGDLRGVCVNFMPPSFGCRSGVMSLGNARSIYKDEKNDR